MRNENEVTRSNKVKRLVICPKAIDHSRLAYVKPSRRGGRRPVTGFVERALAFYERQGVRARRLTTRQRLQLRQERLPPATACRESA
jgi:hypothetical protein